MERRSFLKAMLAACAAPAIVRAESLMKIYVPSDKIVGYADDFIITPGTAKYTDPYYLPATETMFEGFGEGDFTVETWIKPGEAVWKHVAQVQQNGQLLSYIDGRLVPNSEFTAHGFKIRSDDGHFDIGFAKPPAAGDRVDTVFNGHVDSVKVTSLARDPMHLDFNLRRVENEVSKFEREANRGIHMLNSFVDRADAIARQETPTGLLAQLLKRT